MVPGTAHRVTHLSRAPAHSLLCEHLNEGPQGLQPSPVPGGSTAPVQGCPLWSWLLQQGQLESGVTGMAAPQV